MTPLPRHPLRLAELTHKRPTQVHLTPDEAECAAIAEALDVQAVRKLRFDVKLTPMGKTDWHLTGDLAGTVVQSCVVTLDPVTTRIEEPLERKYLAELPEPGIGEVEMPEDDSVEPLKPEIDLIDILVEALALALPPYPRSKSADLGEYVVTEPGATPLTASEMKPFAGLAGLRDKLAGSGENDT